MGTISIMTQFAFTLKLSKKVPLVHMLKIERISDIIKISFYYRCKNVSVFNCASGKLNRLTWGQFSVYVPNSTRKCPF